MRCARGGANDAIGALLDLAPMAVVVRGGEALEAAPDGLPERTAC